MTTPPAHGREAVPDYTPRSVPSEMVQAYLSTVGPLHKRSIQEAVDRALAEAWRNGWRSGHRAGWHESEAGPDYERLVGAITVRIVEGRRILPFPELPQDLVYLGFVIDNYREALGTFLLRSPDA